MINHHNSIIFPLKITIWRVNYIIFKFSDASNYHPTCWLVKTPSTSHPLNHIISPYYSHIIYIYIFLLVFHNCSQVSSVFRSLCHPLKKKNIPHQCIGYKKSPTEKKISTARAKLSTVQLAPFLGSPKKQKRYRSIDSPVMEKMFQ